MQQSAPQRRSQDFAEEAVLRCWKTILNAARVTRQGFTSTRPTHFAADAGGVLGPVSGDGPEALLSWTPGDGWAPAAGCPPELRDLFDLYLPLCAASVARPVTVGHLGQSLDGCIATHSGDSCYVTGQENILHLHRMRALCDAVIVGAQTVAADDPRLTTRLVPGSNAVRVVLDPQRRLAATHGVFNDGQGQTLLVCGEGVAKPSRSAPGAAELLELPAPGGRLDLRALLQSLRERKLYSVFVEGGGVTVSAFLQAGLLDRLQIAVAPMLIGNGRPGVCLPTADNLDQCLRPRCRVFRMGQDILFDCEPGNGRLPEDADGARSGVTRIA